MAIHEKIKEIRKIKGFTQETMAEKLDISVSTYANMENGMGKLNWDKLIEIAKIFDIDIIQLIEVDKKDLDIQKIIYFPPQNNNADSLISNPVYCSDSELAHELEKRDLIIQHLRESISQKDREISILNDLISSLRMQINK